jgi:TatD DNase family protein
VAAELIDTHAHLDGDEYSADLDDVLRRAHDAGVGAIVSAGQDEASSRANIALAARYASVRAAAGVHPHRASEAGDLRWLPEALKSSEVVAVGECGLDYHYDFSPRTFQREIFARQLELAADLGLPVIIHMRESEDDLQRMLREHYAPDRRAVVHCFTGSYELGKALIDEFDVYLGIGGAVTFKKAEALHDAAARLPLERIVLETDCPFMTPAPHRGKRNEPSYMALTLQRLAELRAADPADIAVQTTANAKRLFARLES